MRLILGYLAIAQCRLARFDLERHYRLLDDADAALFRSRQRVELANELAHRAGFEVMRRRAI